MALPAIGIGIAAFAVSEAIAALLEHWVGDPEASVQAALKTIQEKAQYDAMSAYNRPMQVEQDVARAFKGAGPRSLTELALYQQGLFDDKPVLSYVTQSLGMTPDEFMRRTSPTRMGDLSTLQRALPPTLIEKARHDETPAPQAPGPMPPPGAGMAPQGVMNGLPTG